MNSKKQFDYIEEKIKQAVQNSVPAFDEKAWQAMEAKLDKGNKKKPAFVWWVIAPLLLIFGWLSYRWVTPAFTEREALEVPQRNTVSKEKNKSPEELTNHNESANNKLLADEGSKESSAVTSTKPENLQFNTPEEHSGDIKNKRLQNPTSKLTGSNAKKINKSSKGHLSATIQAAIAADENSNNAQADIAINNNKSEEPAELVTPIVESGNKFLEQPDSITTQLEKKPGNIEEQTAKQENALEKSTTLKQPKKPGTKGFYVLATIGADAGSTQFLSFKNNSVQFKYGVGVGYQLSNNWSVQTGFYTSHKKYAALPVDYKIKPGSPMGAYPVEKIDADCKVYEIPLAIRFNFLNKPSYSFYATVGASSYILKKESYDCSYTYYDNVYTKNWQYKGNNHFFSMAVFAVGVEKQISSKLSIIAEPSITAPLSGVGDGSMKIFSAAAQAGIKYHFFNRK